MNKEALEYLKQRVKTAEESLRTIKKLEEFIKQLQECKETETIRISVSMPGYLEKNLLRVMTV